jgi:citrate lyase subunit alpha/citrate CoA-transferase
MEEDVAARCQRLTSANQVLNCLFAGCTILAIPSFRDRIPVIVDEVATLTGPSELIDVVVTERGIAINPRREDLLDRVRGHRSPDPSNRGYQARGGAADGRSARGEVGDRSRRYWVDGTVMNTVWRVG